MFAQSPQQLIERYLLTLLWMHIHTTFAGNKVIDQNLHSSFNFKISQIETIDKINVDIFP